MSINKRFKHYLSSLPLSEQFYFSEEREGASFHWSNWDTLCKLLGKHEKFDMRKEELQTEISQLTSSLKEEAIWINSANKTTQSNMFDLYSLYLDSRVRDDIFHSDKQILYSENNSSGPFHSLTSLKWKNKEVYRLFMLNKILLGCNSLRKFRLHLDLDINIHFDKFPLRNSAAQIEQITEFGMILKVAGSKDFFCLANSNRIKLSMKVEDLNNLTPNLTMDESFKNGNSLDISFSPEILESYGNKRNFSHSREDQIFVFVGFKDLKTSSTTESLIPYFSKVLNNSQVIMQDLLDNYLTPLELGIKRVS